MILVEIFIAVCIIGSCIFMAWALYATVGEMAQDRGHSRWIWWMISMVWSPFIVIFVMWLLFPKRVAEASEEGTELDECSEFKVAHPSAPPHPPLDRF